MIMVLRFWLILPIRISGPIWICLLYTSYVDKHRHVELKDTAFYYFLNVSDYRGAGEEKPYEFARSEVKD